MLDELLSLRHFQPAFYTGSPSRHYLPLFYDAVATLQPRLIVTLGFGDGQAHLTFCQALRDTAPAGRSVAFLRSTDDLVTKARSYAEEFFGEVTEFRDGVTSESAAEFGRGSVDLLLIDDVDSGAEIRRELSAWKGRLSPEAVVFVHGIELERADNPRSVFRRWSASRNRAEFAKGLGLGIERCARLGLLRPRYPQPKSLGKFCAVTRG